MAGDKYKLQVSLSLKDRISKPLKDVRNKISSFDRSLKNVGQAAGNLAGFLGKPLALLAGSGLFSIKSAVDTFSQLGDSIDKAAQRAGTGVVEIQKLQYAAGLGGSSAEAMEGALTKLGQQMNQAAGGGAKEFGAMLQHLGISLKDNQGKVRSSAAVMRELAEAIAEYPFLPDAQKYPVASVKILASAALFYEENIHRAYADPRFVIYKNGKDLKKKLREL